jgi:hypothetical protein
MGVSYKNYVPESLYAIYDLLGLMMLYSPTFIDKTEWFADRNVETIFHALNAGLLAHKEDLGEEKYVCLIGMSDRMRMHFEADPENKTDDTLMGRQLIDDMSDILIEHIRASLSASN